MVIHFLPAGPPGKSFIGVAVDFLVPQSLIGSLFELPEPLQLTRKNTMTLHMNIFLNICTSIIQLYQCGKSFIGTAVDFFVPQSLILYL